MVRRYYCDMCGAYVVTNNPTQQGESVRIPPEIIIVPPGAAGNAVEHHLIGEACWAAWRREHGIPVLDGADAEVGEPADLAIVRGAVKLPEPPVQLAASARRRR